MRSKAAIDLPLEKIIVIVNLGTKNFLQAVVFHNAASVGIKTPVNARSFIQPWVEWDAEGVNHQSVTCLDFDGLHS